MTELKHVEVEGTSGAEYITFGQGLFEIMAMNLQSKNARHVGLGTVYWYTTEPDGTNKSVALMSGWFRSTHPLVLNGTRIVEGPGRLYVLYDLPSAAYALLRAYYRRVK